MNDAGGWGNVHQVPEGDQLAIDFWGAEYGAGRQEAVSADWPVLTFDKGRAIAHSMDDTSITYARTGPDADWQRYERGMACYLD